MWPATCCHVADVTAINGPSLVVSIIGAVVVIYVWQAHGRSRGARRRY